MDKPRYRYYRRILVSVLVVLAVGLASRFYWLRQERARNERLNSLFRAAIGSGAKQSVVRELARNPGQDVDQLLLKIAYNRPGWGGTREAAIQELAKRQAKVAPELARLLQVTEGLDVRLAVAEALQNMSCGDGCIRAVLFYEERLWRGDPTIEDRLADGQSTAYLRSERAAWTRS